MNSSARVLPVRFSTFVKSTRPFRSPALSAVMFQVLATFAPTNVSLPAPPFNAPVRLTPAVQLKVSAAPPPVRFSIDEKVNAPPMFPASSFVMFQVLAMSAPISVSFVDAVPPIRISIFAKPPVSVAAPLCRFTVTVVA